MTRIRVLMIIAIGLIGAVASAAFGTQTPDQKCQQQRYNAAAKYAACQQKAMGKFLGSSDASKFDATNRKCTAKYAATWPKLQAIPIAPCNSDRFDDNGDGTVTDNLTGLVWEQKTDDNTSVHDKDNVYTWSSASNANGTAYTTFLATLTFFGFAGQYDWRLPTIVELESIRALSPTKPYACVGVPCIDTSFFGPEPLGAVYWSSTTSTIAAVLAWGQALNGSITPFLFKTDSTSVRAVRGGL
jgi:uncharacterized protein DUF1566